MVACCHPSGVVTTLLSATSCILAALGDTQGRQRCPQQWPESYGQDLLLRTTALRSPRAQRIPLSSAFPKRTKRFQVLFPQSSGGETGHRQLPAERVCRGKARRGSAMPLVPQRSVHHPLPKHGILLGTLQPSQASLTSLILLPHPA